MRAKKKRFSVSLDPDLYRRLKRLADEKPQLRLQYLVEVAILRLVDAAEEPDARASLRDPRQRGSGA
jgi:predicted transcriptional regulator